MFLLVMYSGFVLSLSFNSSHGFRDTLGSMRKVLRSVKWF